MDRAVARLDADRAACNIDVSCRIVFIVFSVKTVLVGLDADRAVCNQDGFVCFECVRSAGDPERTAGDLKIIFAADAVFGGDDIQRSCAVDDNIISGEDYGVCISVTVCSEGAGDGQCIFGICRCDEYLVGILDINTGGTLIGDRDTVEHQLDLVFISRGYDDLCIRGTAGDHIDTFLIDGVSLAVAHSEILRSGQIRGLFQVTVGKKVGRIDRAAARCNR